MNRWVIRILNTFACIFSMLIFYPITVIVTQLVYLTLSNWSDNAQQITLKEALLSFVLLNIVALIGRAITGLLDDVLHLRPMPRRITTLILAVFGAVGAQYASMLIFDGIARYIIMVLGFFAFWTGSSMYFHPYHQVMNLRRFAAISLVYVAIMLFMITNRCSPFGTASYALMLLLGVLMMVPSMNQGGIDTMMNLRRHRLDQLPPKIRIYNLKLTALLMGLMMLSALFYQPLARLVKLVGRLMQTAFAKLLILMFSSEAESMVSYDYDLFPSEDGEPESDINIYEEPAQTYEFWNVLWYIFVIAVVVVIIAFLPKIIRALGQLFRTLAKRLSDLLHSERKSGKISHSDEYVDVDEVVESIDSNDVEKIVEKPSTAWRNWRNRYRKYSAMDSGEERMRTGYALLLRWLEIQEVPIKESDTTLDIARTADLTLSFDDLNPVTQQFNRMRYGGVSYDLCNPVELDRLLGKMSQTKIAAKLSKLARAEKEAALKKEARR